MTRHWLPEDLQFPTQGHTGYFLASDHGRHRVERVRWGHFGEAVAWPYRGNDRLFRGALDQGALPSGVRSVIEIRSLR
jgi:hypothetical protein